MSPSRSWVLALTLLSALAVAPARSDERTMFETVKGWKVERTVGDTSANPCLMTYSYVDKDDDDAANAVVFTLDGANAVIVLGYEHWAWDKDQKIRAPFAIGKKVINAKSTWVGEGEMMHSSFPATIVPQLMASKTIEVRIKDAAAEFDIPDFAPAYESLRRCNAAPPPSTAPQAQSNAPQVAEGPKPGPESHPAAPAAQPLAIAKLQFVTRPADEFGDIAARGSNAFPAGEKMRTYLEVKGQTIRPAASGQRKFGLRLDYEVLAGDRVLAGQKGVFDQDFTLDAQAPPVPTMYLNVGLNLTGLEPGAYTLAYTLHDKLDGRTATGSLPFASIPAPTPSSPAQLKAYFAGLMFQRTIKDCDFATTARQRSALDAKVAAFDPQPATAAEEIRTHVAADKPSCPDTLETEAKFRTKFGNYLEMSTDAFVAWMDKRLAEQEAQAAPQPTNPAPAPATPAPQ
ncbi:hypothetical protein ASG52_18265 [Methylobacterium sp. Leaf456]|uniref:hypothetical protein n=1 Tax=Methylobacterium sp. Leaf456 TaxID=1736382 RepID=UPI0006F4C246|nr:hypothetical protein [Methylobacterium sp. Leaf456]KQT60072.1 hypothetical protein ASG52_18265 [Methylobacterium sp. Leaf456]